MYFHKQFTWSGRQLETFVDGNKTIEFEYDENGLRHRKTVTVNGIETERYDYVWSEGKLISQNYTESGNTYSAKFIYNNDNVQGFIYNNTTYLFVRNLQNDIVAVVDENGNEVLKINYDAWGVPSYTVGSLGSNSLLELFEKLNPFAYRDYCYDSDIELYYLQSRYYSPEIGRFINTDDTQA